MPVISAKGLHKAYAGFSPVLRGVDIEVEQGELVAIMGPSGCGKSTMLHILGMLHAPDQGSLKILDLDVLTLSREKVADFRRGNMGFVMQSNNLFEHSTVFENVEFPLIYERIKPQERWERVIRALDLVHLSSRVHYPSNRLSGGEQQRVAIARAMVNAPKILLADEPTGALDARTSRLIMEIFRTLCHASGVAMVMVTHDPKMAEYCDSIYTLEEGVLVTKKHELANLENITRKALLAPPTPKLRGALLAKRLPEPLGTSLIAEARLLYEAGLLARIYTQEGSGSLGHPVGYALPLAVRRLNRLSYLSLWPRLFSPTFWKFAKLLPANSFWSKARAILAGIRFASWLKEEKIDYILAADAQSSATAALVASTLSGLPFGFDARFNEPKYGVKDLSTKAKAAKLIRVNTGALERRVRDLWPDIEPEKIVLLRDPLTLSPSEEAEHSVIDTSDHVLTIVAVGRLVKEKGFDILLEAAALLQESMQIKVRIAGSGPEKRNLERLAKSLGGLHSVSFLGQLLPEHMEALYLGADLFVSPARVSLKAFADTIPTSLAEAMAFALPTIVTDLPVLHELIRDGANGLIIPQEDPERLAQAIKSLGQNPERARSLGIAAKKTIEAAANNQLERNKFFERLLAGVQTKESKEPKETKESKELKDA